MGPIAVTLDDSGANITGLGKWSHVKLAGKDNICTRIICAYSPCKTKTTRLHTVYAQHSRYYLSKNINTCPL